jgi:thiamine pyrophosphate-dependent acetolactate synthase large subunit-like protein
MSNVEPTLSRRQSVAALLAPRGNALAVSSLGNPTYDLAAAGDTPANFYLWGAMGGALMVAMGIAIAQPTRRVLAFLGDGEMMMGLGSLASVAVARPTNLCAIVIDNERYAETGGQRAHSGRGVDIVAIARAAGFADTRLVCTQDELTSAIPWLYATPGPILLTLKVSTQPTSPVLPPRDGPYLRSRFREALLGHAAHS